MNEEACYVGGLIPLPTALQDSYNLLSAPQCTNHTYIKTFVHKMLSFISDPDITNIVCHLNEAAGNLNLIHVSAII